MTQPTEQPTSGRTYSAWALRAGAVILPQPSEAAARAEAEVNPGTVVVFETVTHSGWQPASGFNPRARVEWRNPGGKWLPATVVRGGSDTVSIRLDSGIVVLADVELVRTGAPC
jgi:hypothetical protein